MTERADILVIGGGIAGMSAAAELARDASVILLEAEAHPGTHSTGRSAAIYIRNYGNATLKALNRLSEPDLAGGSLGESVLSPRGLLTVADARELPQLERAIANSDSAERLTPAQAQVMVPVLRGERVVAAAYEADAQDIDVDRLMQGFARQLRARGGQIKPQQRVARLTRHAHVWRAETATAAFEAPVIVNAAGAWADELAGMAQLVPIGLVPKRRSAVIMPLPGHVTGSSQWPLLETALGLWYAKPVSGGLMISPADEDPVPPQDAWPEDLVIAEGLDRFSAWVDVPLVRPTHSWAGLRSFVSDGTPVLGYAPDSEGFFWLAGQGGYGVQTCPAMAKMTRALITGGTVDSDLRRALDPARLV